MDVTLSDSALRILLQTIGELATGTLEPAGIAKAQVAVVEAQNALARENAPPGVKPGRVIAFAPVGVSPVEAVDWRSFNLELDAFTVANGLTAAARRVVPDIDLDDVEAWRADPAMPGSQGYFGRLVTRLQAWGFDIVKNPDQLAIYAPGAIAHKPAPVVRKEFRYAAPHP